MQRHFKARVLLAVMATMTVHNVFPHVHHVHAHHSAHHVSGHAHHGHSHGHDHDHDHHTHTTQGTYTRTQALIADVVHHHGHAYHTHDLVRMGKQALRLVKTEKDAPLTPWLHTPQLAIQQQDLLYRHSVFGADPVIRDVACTSLSRRGPPSVS